MGKKKGLDLDTQQIISWCKSNIVLVILIIVSLGAIIGFPLLAATQAEDVRAKLKTRSNKFSELDKYAQTTVSLPGTTESSKVIINQALVDRYVEVTSEIIDEAKKVVSRASKFNRKNYQVLFQGELFPSPTQAQMETIPQYFYRDLEINYKKLLAEVNAGSPVTKEALVTALEEERIRFMDTHLSTRQDAILTQEQRSSLEKHLSKIRMSKLRIHAQDMGVYLEEASLSIPTFSLTVIPSVGELFVWQWRYWAVADVIGSIAAINNRQTELTASIKRVVSLEVLGLPTIINDAPKGGPKSGGTGGGFPNNPGGTGAPGVPFDSGPGILSGPGSGSGKPSGSKPPPPPMPPRGGSRGNDTTIAGGLAASFTGQESGGLFDVLQVRVTLVVDTEKVPSILDGFAAFNFFTVIDLELQPEDKFLALDHGYDFGSASVSRMTVVFETIWLRSWTTKFMPDDVKTVLGIEIETE